MHTHCALRTCTHARAGSQSCRVHTPREGARCRRDGPWQSLLPLFLHVRPSLRGAYLQGLLHLVPLRLQQLKAALQVVVLPPHELQLQPRGRRARGRRRRARGRSGGRAQCGALGAQALGLRREREVVVLQGALVGDQCLRARKQGRAGAVVCACECPRVLGGGGPPGAWGHAHACWLARCAACRTAEQPRPCTYLKPCPAALAWPGLTLPPPAPARPPNQPTAQPPPDRTGSGPCGPCTRR